jgi:hypothetical protein
MDFEIAAKKRKERKKKIKTAGRWLTEPMMEIFAFFTFFCGYFLLSARVPFPNPNPSSLREIISYGSSARC